MVFWPVRFCGSGPGDRYRCDGMHHLAARLSSASPADSADGVFAGGRLASDVDRLRPPGHRSAQDAGSPGTGPGARNRESAANVDGVIHADAGTVIDNYWTPTR